MQIKEIASHDSAGGVPTLSLELQRGAMRCAKYAAATTGPGNAAYVATILR